MPRPEMRGRVDPSKVAAGDDEDRFAAVAAANHRGAGKAKVRAFTSGLPEGWAPVAEADPEPPPQGSRRRR